jgi:hypothetical protein
MSIAYTGCSSGGDGGGGSGGSGGPTAPLSFDAETSRPAAGGAAAAVAFAAQFGNTVSAILGALGNAPEAASVLVTRKLDISAFICPGGGLADLTGQIEVGQEVKLLFNDCAGSPFGPGSVSGEITLAIEEGTNFDSFLGGPIYATAVVRSLDISSGGTLEGGFDVFAEASAGLAMINLRLGNQLDSDLLTWSGGGQVLQLGCFDILQRIQAPSGFVLPLGVANLGGKIYTINDYAAPAGPPRIDFDANGVPRAGDMTLYSGDGSVEGSDRTGPCQEFAGTPAGDCSDVDALFSAGGCISLSGQKFNETTLECEPFEASTSWDKLLDRDFTEGGGELCDGGGTGGSGGSMTGATPGPTTCDPGTDIFAIADAYIRGDGVEGNNSDTPYGNATNLLIKSVTNLYFTRKIYIVFELPVDLTVDPDKDTVSLVLSLQRHVENMNNPALSGPQPTDLWGIDDDDDWDPDVQGLGESEITWNNAPRNDKNAANKFETSPGVPKLISGYDFDLAPVGQVDQPPQKYALDITDYVAERIDNDADGKITILMAIAGLANVDGSAFWSRNVADEQMCDRPFLRVERDVR